MKILDKYFERVVLMTLDPDEDRAKRSIAGLSCFTDNLLLEPAIRGDQLPPAKWWRAGNGAWGCLQTHVRIAQQAWLDGVANYIVFEDDIIFDSEFEQRLAEFMEALPENWDQIYLGGQHRAAPRHVCDEVYEAKRINRTHCFALKRDTIPDFLNHVTDYGDHIESGYPKHIDHRLEDAHKSRRWVTYTPSWWLVGQGENNSMVNGRQHPDKWWDYNPAFSRKLPFVWVDREPSGEELKWIHLGWSTRPDGFKHLDPCFLKEQESPKHDMRVIGHEAFECRRIPGAALYEDPLIDAHSILGHWDGPILKLSETTPDELEELCNYPRNGLFTHRWINPCCAPS
jgi:hypothetical protein|tara:strand:+ start:349 stop:1374 length:1026 start_codon:yes stop_codon:yes gene_type:complete